MPTMGQEPETGWDVVLTSGSDFNVTVNSIDGSDWPTGAQISLVMGDVEPVVWTSVVSGPSFTFARAAGQDVASAISALLTQRPVSRILYTDASGANAVLATGVVMLRA